MRRTAAKPVVSADRNIDRATDRKNDRATDPPSAATIQKNGQTSGRKVWMTGLETRFEQGQANLNRSRSRLIRSIIENAEENYFLSSRALAKRYSVDKATIVRSVQMLGYERYAEFAADLRSHFVSRITPYTLMKAASKERRSVADHVEHSFEIESHNLQALRSQVSADAVIRLAKRLNRARHIMVVGSDFAASLSYLLAYGLASLGYNADAPLGSAGNIQQKVNLLGPKDLLIAISFGRCLQVTVDAVLRARQNGVRTFGITDSDKTPIARFCDSYWTASIANPSFHGSYVAPIAAIDALFVACAHTQPHRSLSALRQKDKDSRSRYYSPPPEDNSKNNSKKSRNQKENEHGSKPPVEERHADEGIPKEKPQQEN
jgi:DNA-binding MurR/RpiR family transcriptional regulator